jgi:hypothetical protein
VMFRTFRVILCAAVLLGTIGATTKILGSGDGEKPGSRIDITQLSRVSGNMVLLKFVMVNDSSGTISLGGDFEGPANSPTDIERDSRTIAGVTLEDAANTTKYTVVRDAQGNCVCSSALGNLAAKSSVNLWAKFPAPPDTVKKLNVVLPHFQPVEDVPLKSLSK